MTCRWFVPAVLVLTGFLIGEVVQGAPATTQGGPQTQGVTAATLPATQQSAVAAGVRSPVLTTQSSSVGAEESDSHAGDISIAWSIPFVLLLGAIALMPFVRKHWWEHNYPKVSVGLAILVGLYYVGVRRAAGPWVHGMQEYVSFIVLLGALFIISGGIAIRVNRKATPSANATLLLIGAVIANVFGTTGAAMLLIRPYLRMNRGHIKPFHVVFFIFVVANVGGALTPIGDPPLFLGYLKGVPFWWVLERMRWPWLMATGLLVSVFYVLDWLDHRKDARVADHDAGPQVHILGIHNFLFIAVVILAVFQASFFDAVHDFYSRGVNWKTLGAVVLSREILMVAAAVASLRMTGKAIHQANEFGFGPIKEVAILFVGIFSTMVPALQWLEHNAEKKLKMETPGQYYFASGVLSSFLDNAPTYLTFLKMRMSGIKEADVDEAAAVLAKLKGSGSLQVNPDVIQRPQVRDAVEAMIKYHESEVRSGEFSREKLMVAFLLGNDLWSLFVVAISAGSVFFGACTYIGNGPNFMVKSIADAAGVKTPGFLEYIYRFTLPVLLPIYIVVWVVFFVVR